MISYYIFFGGSFLLLLIFFFLLRVLIQLAVAASNDSFLMYRFFYKLIALECYKQIFFLYFMQAITL